jgi:hypothetical protein
MNTIASPAGQTPEERSPAASHIIAGGGIPETPQFGRPKRRFCAFASLLWIFPSAGAALILAPGLPPKFQGRSLLEALGAISIEEWTALAILAVHAVFVLLALHYHRTEPLREEPPWTPDSDDDDRPQRGHSPS